MKIVNNSKLNSQHITEVVKQVIDVLTKDWEDDPSFVTPEGIPQMQLNRVHVTDFDDYNLREWDFYIYNLFADGDYDEKPDRFTNLIYYNDDDLDDIKYLIEKHFKEVYPEWFNSYIGQDIKFTRLESYDTGNSYQVIKMTITEEYEY